MAITKLIDNLPVLDKDFIHTSPVHRPKHLVMSDLHWKYLVRNVIRGKNILLAGYTGSGKTTFAKAISDLLGRPFFKFNLGATQDPRATLIGNTFFDSVKGTYFKESEFVTAIQTPNAVILLDEVTRAHPDAENILMTVLDHQRYLKLDEDRDQRTINVAPNVCFIGAANFGNEFTTTRVLDRATLDRYMIIEMPLLSQLQEYNLLVYKYPNVDKNDLHLLTKLTALIRANYISDNKSLSNMVSTRMCEEIAMILEDGFTLPESLEVTVLPLFDAEGGSDSERKQVIMLIDSINISKNIIKKGKGNISPENVFLKIRNNQKPTTNI